VVALDSDWGHFTYKSGDSMVPIAILAASSDLLNGEWLSVRVAITSSSQGSVDLLTCSGVVA
jgi:hypothetical protein